MNRAEKQHAIILLMAFLTFISAFPPLATDLYLPAMPSMGKEFGASAASIQFTLSGFTICFALSMLIWGPLSDKFGRKPILFCGAAFFIVASVIAALAPNLEILIAARALQGVGSAALSNVAMSIVKDSFSTHRVEKLLAFMQTFIVLAPMIAPVLGGAILLVTSWQGIFWILAASGAIALCAGFFVKESLKSALEGHWTRSLSRIPFVLKNRGFLLLLLLFSAMAMPFMAFLAVSSYIYQSVFAVSAQAFGLYFALTAFVAMLGAIAYIKFFCRFSRYKLLLGVFIVVAIAGALLLIIGAQDVFIFTALAMLISFVCSVSRAPATVLMLYQLDTDTGTVSALMGSAAFLFGAFSMLLCSLPWKNLVYAYGTISCVLGIFATFFWIFLNHKKLFREVSSKNPR